MSLASHVIVSSKLVARSSRYSRQGKKSAGLASLMTLASHATYTATHALCTVTHVTYTATIAVYTVTHTTYTATNAVCTVTHTTYTATNAVYTVTHVIYISLTRVLWWDVRIALSVTSLRKDCRRYMWVYLI